MGSDGRNNSPEPECKSHSVKVPEEVVEKGVGQSHEASPAGLRVD